MLNPLLKGKISNSILEKGNLKNLVKRPDGYLKLHVEDV